MHMAYALYTHVMYMARYVHDIYITSLTLEMQMYFAFLMACTWHVIGIKNFFCRSSFTSGIQIYLSTYQYVIIT